MLTHFLLHKFIKEEIDPDSLLLLKLTMYWIIDIAIIFIVSFTGAITAIALYLSKHQEEIRTISEAATQALTHSL